MQPYEKYDAVLARYAEWLLTLREKGVLVADGHGSVERHLGLVRQKQPDYRVSRDGIHPDASGHFAIARALMRTLGFPEEVDAVEIDAVASKVVRGKVSDLHIPDSVIQFTWESRLPMPKDPAWHPSLGEVEQLADRVNRHRLHVNGIKGEKFQLFESEKLLGTVTREQLQVGVDMTGFPDLSTNQRAASLWKEIETRQRILGLAWLTDVGHQRPDTPKGIPLADAQARAATMESAIVAGAAPVKLRLRIVPLAK
jgi:hypothetical protein